MAVSRRLRFEILRRDNYTCRYCGASAPDVTLEVDHVIPSALGGGDTPNNLVTSCENCNRGKSSTTADLPEVEDIDATAALVDRAQRLASERRQMELGDLEQFLHEFAIYWQENAYCEVGYNGQWSGISDWENSVERFLAEGLAPKDLFYYVRVTGRSTAKKPWSYYCGCCWKEIARRQEDARRLIEDGEV